MACPICNRETVAAFKPFCSRRCADVDLARWFGGTYAVAGAMAENDEEDAQADDGEA